MQRDDHVLLVRTDLKKKLNESETSLWRGGYTNLKPGEGSMKLKKRKTGLMEGDLFFSYERAT